MCVLAYNDDLLSLSNLPYPVSISCCLSAFPLRPGEVKSPFPSSGALKDAGNIIVFELFQFLLHHDEIEQPMASH